MEIPSPVRSEWVMKKQNLKTRHSHRPLRKWFAGETSGLSFGATHYINGIFRTMNLIYIIAFDRPGLRGGRTMSKLLCSSLLRGFWSGQIVVFRNFEAPLFPVERKGLEEVFIGTPNFGTWGEFMNGALEARFRAVEWIKRPEQYEWIIYLDADCLALRDVEHLFTGDADLLVQPERGKPLEDIVFNGYLDETPENQETTLDGKATDGDGNAAGMDRHDRAGRNSWLGRDGINAGTFAVRGEKFTELMTEWRRIYESKPVRHSEFRDQTAFNKLLLNTSLRVKPFERGEIMFPFHIEMGFLEYKEAALLHFAGGKQKDKIDLAFALHMMRTYGDEGGLFLDLLES
jgi:hypothetical protein